MGANIPCLVSWRNSCVSGARYIFADEGVKSTPKGLVSMRSITIIATISSIYRKSHIIPEILRPECILQSKLQLSQQYEDWSSSARRIIVWHENLLRLFINLFTMDKCLYSQLWRRTSHPFKKKRHMWQYITRRESWSSGRSGSNGVPTSKKSGKWCEKYLNIWNGYIAC